MEKYKKPLQGAVILAVVAVIAWVVLTIPDAPAKEDNDNGLVIQYDGNEIFEEKNGRRLWDLKAEHIEMDTAAQVTKLQQLTGHFYAEDGRITELKADEGQYNESTKDVVVTGNVQVENSDGAKLTSKELIWQAKEEILTAKGEARITKDDMQADGDSIESRDGFNKFKISGKAHLVKGGKSQ